MVHCSGKRWKIPPIKVVQNLHQHGGKIPPSAWRWKNSTMPHPPFLVEFFHLFADGGKVVANSTYKGGPKSPPIWWNFSTISKEVENTTMSYPPFLVDFFHHLEAGGTLSRRAFVNNCSGFCKYCGVVRT